MKSRKLALIALFLLGVVSHGAYGQSSFTTHTLKLDQDAKPPGAQVEQLAWIAGHWRGEALGGVAEEVWVPPSAGTMMGNFKLTQEGKVQFYEFFIIAPEGDSLTLKLKHFSADMKGWEEKDNYVSFPLVKLTDEAAYFQGLTMEKNGANQMTVYVAVKKKDGTFSEYTFPYERVSH